MPREGELDVSTHLAGIGEKVASTLDPGGQARFRDKLSLPAPSLQTVREVEEMVRLDRGFLVGAHLAAEAAVDGLARFIVACWNCDESEARGRSVKQRGGFKAASAHHQAAIRVAEEAAN